MSDDKTPYQPVTGIKPDSAGNDQDVEQQQGTAGISTGAGQSVPSSSGSAQGFQTTDTRLGQIIQNLFQRAEGAMQAFRIPGTNTLVVDRRDDPRQDKDDKKSAEQSSRANEVPSAAGKQMEIKEGKVRNVHERGYENYLGDRKLPFADRQAEGKAKERPLSDFEKLVVERFEKSRTLESISKDGSAHFLEKTIGEWRDFFAKFTERTGKRVADLSDIQEFLFRGIVKKDGAKAVMISDIVHADGKTDKFARFSVLYQKLSDMLARLLPGDRISRQSMSSGLIGEELMYLALNPPDIGKGFIMEKQPKLGMFARQSTENRVAKELGLAGYDKGQFVPSSLPANRKKIPFITRKLAFYSAVIIGLILVFLFVIDRLLIK